jgi:hypothetical protein
MADVVGSPVADLTSAESAGDETEHSLLSVTSAGECSDGDASGPAGASGKPTDHADAMVAVKKQVCGPGHMNFFYVAYQLTGLQYCPNMFKQLHVACL